MFSEKSFVITIGNYGAILVLHDGNNIKHKSFIEEINDTTKQELEEIFTKNSSSPIYIILDTVDQSYKKKVYPLVRRLDLTKLVRRDLASDADKESLKNYIILNQKTPSLSTPSNNKWECLFVSSSSSEAINKWIEFLMEMPNRLVGIYMSPIESFNLFKLIKSAVRSEIKIQNKKNDLYCLIIQSKVSGIRQVVFSNQGIVFTRVVNYDFTQKDFLEKYEQDIYSTFEYLKRLFPDITIAEIDIINIFPDEILSKIKTLNNIEINFINYSPQDISAKVGYPNLLDEDGNFCDLLISKIFSKEKKKILKFMTPKIAVLEGFFAKLKISYYLNLALLIAIIVTAIFSLGSQHFIKNSIELAATEKLAAAQELEKIKLSTLKTGESASDQTDIAVIMDFGRMEELLGSLGSNFFDFYLKLDFLKNFKVILKGFSYSLPDYNNKNPVPNPNYKVEFNGDISNKSGDIEDLFKDFDLLVADVKKNFNQNQLKYSELPRNIDFNQKYYTFPVQFTITKNP